MRRLRKGMLFRDMRYQPGVGKLRTKVRAQAPCPASSRDTNAPRCTVISALREGKLFRSLARRASELAVAPQDLAAGLPDAGAVHRQPRPAQAQIGPCQFSAAIAESRRSRHAWRQITQIDARRCRRGAKAEQKRQRDRTRFHRPLVPQEIAKRERQPLVLLLTAATNLSPNSCKSWPLTSLTATKPRSERVQCQTLRPCTFSTVPPPPDLTACDTNRLMT